MTSTRAPRWVRQLAWAAVILVSIAFWVLIAAVGAAIVDPPPPPAAEQQHDKARDAGR